MAELLLDSQGTPAAPSAGTALLYPDSGNGLWTQRTSTLIRTLPGIRNFNNADEVANAVDTYLAGSKITVPQHGLQAGTIFKWVIGMTKTAAGIAAPIWNIRVGTAGTTADAARVTFTSPSAQTAATDAGQVEIYAILRNTGAAGVMAGVLSLWHNNATTGFASVSQIVVQATSAGFDTTTANLLVGISVNPGAAGVWTHQVIASEAFNI